MGHARFRLALSIAVMSAGVAAFALRDGDATAKPDAAGARYFEMRTYHAPDGKLDALHARFRDHTIKLFKKHGIESIAYWTAADKDGNDANTLVFVLAYPSRGDRDRMWDAFAQDPEWVKAKAESEKDGALVEKVVQTFMNPTDYSPIK
jgi:hypothetical protein